MKHLTIACVLMLLGARSDAVDFQSRIDATARAGGGVVRVGAGRHETRGLYLRSNVELHLERNAVLIASGSTNDYRRIELPYSEGAWMAVVMSVGETNVAVTGEGVIDGNGRAFLPSDVSVPNPEGGRPRGLLFANCRGVRLEDFTLRDAACWGIVLKCSEDVVARRVKVDSHANLNNDGFDIEARNVLIEGCDVDSGDDAYCIKSNNPDFAVEHVIVRNCVGRSFCNVFKLGTASHGIMRDIRFERCRSEPPRRDLRDARYNGGCAMFENPRRAALNFSNRGEDFRLAVSGVSIENVDGGIVEDIVCRDLSLAGINVPLFIRGGARTGRGCGILPNDKYLFRRILVENVVGTWGSKIPSSITGVAGCRPSNVVFRNIRLRGPGGGTSIGNDDRPVPEYPGRYPSANMFGMPLPAWGLYARHVDGLVLEDVDFELETGTFDNRERVVLDDCILPWEMAQATAPERWMPAVVPGTVLTTLVKNGVVPDPYQGLNNKIEEGRLPDLANDRAFYEAMFRTKVCLPFAWTNRVVWMRPEGINYRSEIYLNGKLATSTRGMFSRNAVDVSPFVKAGAANDLVVKVWPVDHPGTTKPKKWGAANGEWHNGGDGEIGRDVTMLMSAGWDFTFSDGIRDRNTGIWKDIAFFATDAVRIDHPFVRTKLNADFSEAELMLEVDLQNAFNGCGGRVKGTVVAEVLGTDVRFEKAVSLFRGERRTEFLTAKLRNPKLWWPRNKGAQDLYDLAVRYVDAGTGKVSDEKRIRFGVRELTSDQSGKGGARQFYCNRRKIFIRGTNWIPEAMLKADDARMEKEMRLTAESGVNLVRLWAGGIVESDRFYDLCDKYGLLVWQEFWMTGDTRHPDDPGLYLDNVAQQVKRIRHHASLAHWVCSNESTEVCGIEALVKGLTGTTSWMMQSECDGVHDGSPYFPVNPMRYYADTASPRGSRVYGFSPEYGTCALPCYEQILSFMPENLLWPMKGNEANWKYREGGGFDQMTKYHHLAVQAYGESKSLEEYARKSQAADAMSHRCIWETWNLVRNRATGVLFWYNNTPIPQLGSHAWDYDLNQEAAFFAQKNALEPLHAQFEYLSNRVFVVSDIVEDKRLSVRAEVYDFESRKVWEKEAKVEVEGEGCVEAFTIPFDATRTSRLQGLTKPHFIKLRLFESGKEIASTFYWRSNSVYSEEKREEAVGPCAGGFEELVNLPRTMLKVERTVKGVKVTNTGDRLAFFVRIKAMKDGKLVVPVRYSDNYLSLLPGEMADVLVDGLPESAELKVAAWNAEW